MMDQPPVVSIIIPTFNAREWVCAAIDSALMQAEVACEVIVVDDGSTDDTGSLLRSGYGDRITYVFQSNRGLAAARNTGLARASGEYVQFLDADDLLLPSKVATQVAALTANPDVTVAYCDFASFVDADAERTSASGMRHRYRSGDVRTALIEGNFIVVHAAMARLADVRAVGGFDETLTACEDYDLWLRLAVQGRTFLHTPGVFALYRRRSDSMSSQWSRQVAASIAVLEKLSRTQTLDPEQLEALRQSVDRLRDLMPVSLVRDSLSLFRTRRFRDAGSCLIDAVSYDPLGTPRRVARLCGFGYERFRARGRRARRW